MRASERAYRSLRQDIVDGDLPPGAVLGEVEQSERLGLSRTPLREAIGRLVAEGLAAPAQGRGVVVTEVSLAEAGQLFDLRTVLEGLAVRRAAEHAEAGEFSVLAERFEAAVAPLRAGEDPAGYYGLTAELDAAVDQACVNPYLAQNLRGLRVHLARLRRFSRNDPDRLAASATEHAEIARAVAAGNPELAGAATTVHLQHALAHLQSHRDHPAPTTATPPSPTPERTP
ncbi:GntR family transcriptional regulator [Citricoccus sp. SGAir0253]|uniref:GntR family transcriptional regulator n=1 Tax=Citricoccus sp. SGAir0253 TaxID=2567881 RepID=UPI0010CCD5E1|nr:GntR family transcriptional regulator [Citricoccus sp. SGAir0253]QCU77796.1 GntR family transcriptional regulator [Citricoccus sp. SGAir0253]